VALSTDDSEFGGFNRIAKDLTYSATPDASAITLYLPARTAVVLEATTGN